MLTLALALLGGKWRTYLAIAGISLVIVIGAYVKGYMAGRDSGKDAALDKAREGQVNIIKETQVITKAIRGSKDACITSVIPKPVADSLRY